MTVFGLIGYGKIGERHANCISVHPDALLAGAFDIKKERLNLFADLYKDALAYKSVEEVIHDKRIDIVSICTPNYTHADITIAALQAGKHVLVEKPMAIKKVDCEAMIHTSLKTGKSLFVVKQNRFNPPVQAVKKLLDEKKNGKDLFHFHQLLLESK